MSMRCALLAIAVVLVLTPFASAQPGPLRRLFRGPVCVPAPVCVLVEAKPVVAAEAWNTLGGSVTFAGDLPKIVDLTERFGQHPDKQHLLKAPKEDLRDPAWRIDPKTLGVANVCVFIKRPKDGVLPIHPDDRVRKESVVMEAPHSVFKPHMTALYAEWFDGVNRGATGQKFVFRNNSELAISFRAVGNPRYNPGWNYGFPRKAADQEFKLNPQLLPIIIQSDFHSWATAYVWVFDHPYFAITKPDGTFTIPRVPAGMEVQVMAWHESQGWLFTIKGKTMKLAKGKNTLDFEISAK